MTLNWKAPTWKGLIGLLALASSVVTALTVSPTTLPHNYEVALGVVGGVLLAVERWADAQDNQAATQAATAERGLVAAAARQAGTPLPDPPHTAA